MSVAVGVEARGGAWLAVDSCLSSKHEKCAIAGKAFVVNGIGLGPVGELRALQAIRYHLTCRKPGKLAAKDPVGWAVRNLVPALQRVGKKNELFTDSKGIDLIAIVVGHVLVIQDDWGVVHPLDGYAAIGTGGLLALGALHTQRGERDPEMTEIAARCAVEAAAHHCPTVDGCPDPIWVPA